MDDPVGGDQTMGFFWNVLAKGDGNSFNRIFFSRSLPIPVCDKVRGAQSTVWYRRVQVSVWPERATALIAHGHDMDDRCTVLAGNAEQQQSPQQS